jgi:hypothetical protein
LKEIGQKPISFFNAKSSKHKRKRKMKEKREKIEKIKVFLHITRENAKMVHSAQHFAIK